MTESSAVAPLSSGPVSNPAEDEKTTPEERLKKGMEEHMKLHLFDGEQLMSVFWDDKRPMANLKCQKGHLSLVACDDFLLGQAECKSCENENKPMTHFAVTYQWSVLDTKTKEMLAGSTASDNISFFGSSVKHSLRVRQAIKIICGQKVGSSIVPALKKDGDPKFLVSQDYAIIITLMNVQKLE